MKREIQSSHEHRLHSRFILVLTSGCMAIAAGTSHPGLCADATVPGEITTPYPTIIHLAVEWAIQGDDNLNATCSVSFRESGKEQWREGLPLRRVPAGKGQTVETPVSWSNKFSGSLFDLKPDTEYEISLKLQDPDGESFEKMARARTRPVPRAAPDAPVKKVDPVSLAAELKAAQPGDILLLAAGQYGQVVVAQDGAPRKPIVLRSEAPHQASFDSISMIKRKHVYIEGVSIKNSQKGEPIAGVNMTFAEDCVVRRCKIEAICGVLAQKSKNNYIADNVLQGAYPWEDPLMGAAGKTSGNGVKFDGPGNVVCFNTVTGYRDCLSHIDNDLVCDDMYNNDVSQGLDDGIEADYARGNCRILRNRLTNCFIGLSSQPGLGGPTYFIRNVMYNITYMPFKLYRFSQGDVCLHNTVVKVGDGMSSKDDRPFDHAYFRNNLFIGGAGKAKWGNQGYNNASGQGIARAA